MGGFTAGPHGFLLDKRFRLKDTVQCLGATETQPEAINRYGEICGFCTANKVRGFYRNKQRQYVFLDFPGATITEAVGINNYGHVVGDYRDSGGRFHGFFWSYGLFLTVDVPFSGAADTSPTSFMAFCVKVAHSAVSMCRFPELRRLRLAASMIEERSLGGIWTVILLVMDSWQSKCEARHQRRLSNRHCLVYSKLYDADGRNQFSIWRRI